MIERYLYLSTVQDLLRPRRIAVWLFVVGVLFLIAKGYLFLNSSMSDGDAYSLLSSILVFRLLPLASAIFSTTVVSQEIEQKTIVYLLTRPVPRWKLLLFRSLASVTVVALVGFLCAVGVAVAVFGMEGLGKDLLWNDVKGIVMGALAYGSLFILVSLLINRAMIFNLLFAFGWEISVPNMQGNMYWLSIGSYLSAVSERPSTGGMGSQPLMGALAGALGNANTISTQTGWMVLLSLVTICLAVGAWWFSYFEYLPREDAE